MTLNVSLYCFDLVHVDVDIDRLQFFALHTYLHIHAASHLDLYADSTPHTDANTDAFAHAGLRRIPVEACMG